MPARTSCAPSSHSRRAPVYASRQRHRFTPITSSSWSGLFVGTYLPGGGRIFGLREALEDEAKRRNPRFRYVGNRNLRTEWILDAVAARHPDLGRCAVLEHETLNNLRRYMLGRPLDFAAMQARKLERMWVGYDRGSFHDERGWISRSTFWSRPPAWRACSTGCGAPATRRCGRSS